MSTESWSCEHFSKANPRDSAEMSSVPALLRRVADSIEALGPVDIEDLVLHTDVAEDGCWPSITVYFQRP